MKRLFYLSLFSLFILGLTYWLLQPDSRLQSGEEEGEEKSIKFAFEENFERTKDLELGYPPLERMVDALEFTKRLQAEYEASIFRDGIEKPKWRERGPNNIGGRTRAILIDQRDPERKTIWAGGVAGGIWKTEDITASDPEWQIVSDYLEYMAIGALAQDPTNPDVFYAGTGEGYPNWEAVAGFGIYKSSDGGENWELLPSTQNSTYTSVRDLFVHPETGHVYAATQGGLRRSKDGGLNWEKVLGSNVGLAAEDMYDIDYASANNYIFVSNRNSAFKSQTGDPNDWIELGNSSSGFPTGMQRIEITVCQSDPDVLYVIGNQGGGASQVYTSVNGGANWTPRARPNNNEGNEFTNGQAWYDLEIAVDPFNCNHVIVGGVPIMRSLNAGLSFDRFAQNMHVDQHKVVFDEQVPNLVYFGNDGGFYRSAHGSAAQVQNKNLGYNVTQFYACAIHPEPFSDIMIGGTQDNNSLFLNSPGIGGARSVWGGDGFLCHIDEDEPNIMIVSSQFGNWGLSTDGGLNFTGGVDTQSGFLTDSDYDSESNIMYSETDLGDLYRWNINTNAFDLIEVANAQVNITNITVDPNISNRIYLGNAGGRIIRIDDAHEGMTVEGVELTSFSGTVSSIDIELGNPDHLLATVSNFGIGNSIVESKDGGQTWIGVEGQSLPDMPVRWGIFNPNDASQAMIATEAGVWTTELLDGNNTQWIPPSPDRGIPLVRVDMLQLRRSDKIVLAATHGRGLFTTDVFADPMAKLDVPRVHYLDSPLRFSAEQSLNADSYLWDFGDGETDTLEIANHSYTDIGEYPVSLTINNNLSDNSSVKILPDHGLPYEEGAADYSGSFEGMTEQYGVHTISGSGFERGKSTIPGKDGTKSGDNAFVIGLEEEFYQPNSHSVLYLPNFDFTENTIYEFSFWAKYRLQGGLDGFLVEYSLDRGQSWQLLGRKESDWYNFQNDNLDNAVFPGGTPYFSNNRTDFTQFKLNVSFLSGNPDVAFRFVFKSDGGGNHTGLAIDDVKITKYEGEAETKLVKFTGEFVGPTEMGINWNTLPEFYCQYFELERSTNGRDFEVIETVESTGVLTADLQEYETEVFGPLKLYFFRLHVFNEDIDNDYAFDFYSPTIVVRKDFEGVEVLKVFPNPFQSSVELTFSDVVDQPLKYELFDDIGRILTKGTLEVDDVYTKIELGNNLPVGTYFLTLQIGDGEVTTHKLLRN
jgi:photosystem II stability/assembly factor-like uncharacterized protein